MRALVQRVQRAQVTVSGAIAGAIGPGLCVFVGVGAQDGASEAATLAEKIAGLRIFEDPAGKMNLSVSETGGGVLAVSQFTLFGDVRKGRRPSFVEAMEPEGARVLFESFVAECRARKLRVETGRFREHMQVELVNDGPVTILVDTERRF